MSEFTKFETRMKSARNNLLPGVTVSTKDGLALIKEIKGLLKSQSNEAALNDRISILESVLATKNEQIDELSKPVTVIVNGEKF